MPDLRLVIFDVDGTLVDSEADIFAAMSRAYGRSGVTMPERAAIRAIVGLSLDAAFPRLSPGLSETAYGALIDGYKAAYMELRAAKGPAESSPLFPQAREVLASLGADPWTLLAVATGKSRRGLDKLIEGHGLEDVFVTRQVADDHPSKPHPSMILTALAETGVAADRAVMIGDTTFDMDMARAAGVRTIGVAWGYHPVSDLNADAVAQTFDDIPALVDQLIGKT